MQNITITIFNGSRRNTLGYALCILCFVAGCQKAPPGILYLEGIVTLDGQPVNGVSVILHPRCGEGTAAGGMTDARGRFRVTTGTAPIGSGAKEGEYDVTFSKIEVEREAEDKVFSGQAPAPMTRHSSVPTPVKRTHIIPERYGKPRTSGLEPITVALEGNNRFTFELESEKTAAAPTDNIDRVADGQRVTEQRATAQRAAARRAAEQLAAEQLAAEQLAAEQLAAEQHAAEQLATEQHAAERLAAEQLAAEQRAAERLAAEQLAAAQRAVAEQRIVFRNIFEAARRGTVEDVQFFLERDPSLVNATTPNNGWTPLHYAAQHNPNNVEVLQYLIDKGAPINARGNRGETPLDVANVGAQQDVLRDNGGRRGWGRGR